jgi:lysophospholipase L1-like esterase
VSRIHPISTALAAAITAGLLTVGAPAHAAGPLRVLITGDSITQGFHGDYTWRYRLDREFRRQGVAFDFVGSRTGPIVRDGYTSASYADPGFDTNHFALAGSLLGSTSQRIDNEIRAQDPDLVVLAAGINNLRNGSSPQTTNNRLRDWIASARSAKPNVQIIISPVLDAADPQLPPLTQDIREYNQLAADTAAQLTTPTSPITVADTTRGWSIAVDTYDNLHPNPTGETLIAQRIAETLHLLGHLPQAPDIHRPTVWGRVARTSVAMSGQRAVLRWDAQALGAGRVWLRRVGQAGYLSPSHFTGGTMTTTPLVPGATYEFRVQFVRGRMSTPFGPIVRAKVPPIPRPAPVGRVSIDASGVHWTRSAGASRYRVQFKRAHRRWVTRTTTALALRATKVKRARVWAVNAAGRSAVRAAAR